MNWIRNLGLLVVLYTAEPGLAQNGAVPLGALKGTPEQRAAQQQLFRPENSLEEMGAALESALQAGVDEQVLLEAQMLWGLRRQDMGFLMGLVPELEALIRQFDPGKSVGISSLEELRGWVSYIRAMTSLSNGDEEAFERFMKEAFWNHPTSAPVFAQAVEMFRRQKKMADLKLDLAVVLTTSRGDATTLMDELGEGKALLVDFWASWCQPCMVLMPELRAKSEHLSQYGVVVAGMNTDAQNAETVAEKIRRERDLQMPWLVEPGDRPYSKALGLSSIPSMVLVDRDGKVLFFGHPQSPELWQALKRVDPAIAPPSS